MVAVQNISDPKYEALIRHTRDIEHMATQTIENVIPTKEALSRHLTEAGLKNNVMHHLVATVTKAMNNVNQSE